MERAGLSQCRDGAHPEVVADEPPDGSSDLGAFIRDRRTAARLSLRRLADLAGVSNPYLSQIERGLRTPSALILRQIAAALSISDETLYVRAGILDERPRGHDLVGDILRAPGITDFQKQALIAAYQAFRRQNEAGPPSTGFITLHPPGVDGQEDRPSA